MLDRHAPLPALVLTAGLATRLRPLSLVRAKAVLPVAGEPLARRILRSLREAGTTDAVLNLHHLPASITSRIGDGRDLDMRVRYSWESPVLGSAGGPRRALAILGSPTFLIVNGDTLTDVPIGEVVAHHRRTRALVTMAVVPNTEPAKYGGVLVDSEDRVTGFVGCGSGRPSFHFVGVQVAEAEAFGSVPLNAPFESVGALYPALIHARMGSVMACRTSATFFDIGTPADYAATSFRLAPQNDAWWQGARTRIHPSSTLRRTVLWDDVIVGADVRLDDCVVCDNVEVPAGSEWRHAIIRAAGTDLLPQERQEGNLAISQLPPLPR